MKKKLIRLKKVKKMMAENKRRKNEQSRRELKPARKNEAGNLELWRQTERKKRFSEGKKKTEIKINL